MKEPRIVAIGASAGGLDSFRELIENLPIDTDMAFVLLSHILRSSNSLVKKPRSSLKHTEHTERFL